MNVGIILMTMIIMRIIITLLVLKRIYMHKKVPIIVKDSNSVLAMNSQHIHSVYIRKYE